MPRRARYGTTYAPSHTMYGGAPPKSAKAGTVALGRAIATREEKLPNLNRQRMYYASMAVDARRKAEEFEKKAVSTALKLDKISDELAELKMRK